MGWRYRNDGSVATAIGVTSVDHDNGASKHHEGAIPFWRDPLRIAGAEFSVTKMVGMALENGERAIELLE